MTLEEFLDGLRSGKYVVRATQVNLMGHRGMTFDYSIVERRPIVENDEDS